MGYRLTSDAYATRGRGLRGAVKALYAFLCHVANDRNGVSWWSIDKIADAIGFCRRTVQRGTNFLVQLGLVRVLKRQGGRGLHNVYQVLKRVTVPPEEAAGVTLSPGRGKGDTGEPSDAKARAEDLPENTSEAVDNVVTEAPLRQERVTFCPKKGDTSVPLIRKRILRGAEGQQGRSSLVDNVTDWVMKKTGHTPTERFMPEERAMKDRLLRWVRNPGQMIPPHLVTRHRVTTMLRDREISEDEAAKLRDIVRRYDLGEL